MKSRSYHLVENRTCERCSPRRDVCYRALCRTCGRYLVIHARTPNAAIRLADADVPCHLCPPTQRGSF